MAWEIETFACGCQPFLMDNTIADNDLATEGTRASTAMYWESMGKKFYASHMKD